MNDYHDRPTGEPHPGTEDRPVAGWPGHGTDEHATDEHEQTGEHTGEAAREDEPLVGEVWNDESAGEHENATGTARSGEHGHHEAGGQTGESETGLAEGE